MGKIGQKVHLPMEALEESVVDVQLCGFEITLGVRLFSYPCVHWGIIIEFCSTIGVGGKSLC